MAVAYVVRDGEYSMFGKKYVVSNTFELFQEVKNVYNIVWNGIEEAGDYVE